MMILLLLLLKLYRDLSGSHQSDNFFKVNQDLFIDYLYFRQGSTMHKASLEHIKVASCVFKLSRVNFTVSCSCNG